MSAPLRIIFLSYERGLTQPSSEAFERVERLGEADIRLSAIVLPATQAGIVEQGNLRAVGLTGNAPVRLWKAFQATVGEVRRAQKKGERVLLSAQDPFITGALAFVVSRLWNVPYEIQEHGDYFSGAWVREAPLTHRPWSFIGRALLRRADAVRVVSERIRDRLIAQGVAERRMRVIPVAQNVAALLKRPTRPWTQTPTIVVPCRFVKQKGLDTLMRALAQLKNEGILFRVRLIGEGPEGPRIAAMANRQGLQDDIRFEQWSDSTEIWMDADLFVLASHYEGWGRTIPEAMAAGVPVVTTDVGCVGSFFRPQIDGRVVPPGDAAALAAAMREQCTEPERRDILAQNARARVAELPTASHLCATQRQAWRDALENDATPTTPEDRRLWLGTAAVLTIALAVRLAAVVLFADPAGSNREWGFFNLVEHFFQGAGYSFTDVPGYVSAYRSPGFLFFLTGVYGLFGFANFLVQIVIQALLAVVLTYLVYRLAWRITTRRPMGWLAALITIAHPYTFYHYTQYYHTVLSGLFLVSLVLCLLALERTKQYRWAIATGAATAALAYVQGTILPAMPFLALWLVWRWRTQPRRATVAITLIALVSAGLIAPWTIRNSNAFHAFVPLTTDLGLAFYKANNENIERLMDAGYPHELLQEETHPTDPTRMRYHFLPEVQAMLKQTGGIIPSAYWTEWHPIEPSPKAIQVQSPVSEPAYSAHWMELGRAWIKAHPADFARLALKKALVFWQPGLYPSVKYGAAWSFGNEGAKALLARGSLVLYGGLLALLALTGTILMAHRKQLGTLMPILIVCAVYTAMHMLFIPYTKYRIPLDNLTAILAAIALGAAWARGTRKTP